MTTKADRHLPSNRPKKSSADKKARQKVHRRRLMALGLSEEKINKLNAAEMRALLRRPKKIKAG